MRVLIADDDRVSRETLRTVMGQWGYDVELAEHGAEAWLTLQQPDPPPLAILDWVMPEMDGIELCRNIRSLAKQQPYIILLTARSDRADLVAGLRAGADDYVTKPFDRTELQARVQVGVRVVELQQSLANRVRELEDALAEIKQLGSLLPICSYCKKIRDDRNYWHQLEAYISEHSNTRFSHGICPACYEKLVQREFIR